MFVPHWAWLLEAAALPAVGQPLPHGRGSDKTARRGYATRPGLGHGMPCPYESKSEDAGRGRRRNGGSALRALRGSNVVRAAWRRTNNPVCPRRPFANLACTGRRTNRNSLIAIGLLGIGFVSYFFLCVNAGLCRLPHYGRWVKCPRRTLNEWLRAGNHAHPAGPRPDGHGLGKPTAVKRPLPLGNRRGFSVLRLAHARGSRTIGFRLPEPPP